MGQFDDSHTVVSIKNRLKRLGVNLDRYIGQITNKWDSTPAGFGFACKDQLAYTALMNALVLNTNFGTDNMIGGSQHHGVSFREVNQVDSLHIVLSTRPDSMGATCSIHLDSVSVAADRDPKTGQVIYDTSQVLQHLATDLLHTPLIVPSGEHGIVFGFRF
jgi:hypothetical protein